jgi:hypothetical protein
MRKSSYIFIIFLFMANCSGSEGPTGPKGPQGEKGPEGAANITTKTFTITTNNTKVNSDGNIARNMISMPEITSGVYNNGLVKVEISGFFVDGYSGLPLTVDTGSESLTIDYAYNEGQLYIVHIYTGTTISASLIQTGPYKVIIIPPSQMQGAANTSGHKIKNNINNYIKGKSKLK